VSQENAVLVVRLLLEHFVATGEPAWGMLHDDVEVHDHDILDAGEYRGHAGFGRWLEDWGSAWSEYSIEPRDYIDAGERVVAVIGVRAIGRGSGVAVKREDALVWLVRGGKALCLDYYNTKPQALKAVGLEE